MPSDYPNTPKALFREANKIADTDLEEYFKSTVHRRWCDAMVVDVDEFANRYVVNIHMNSLSAKPTHKKILATNLEPTRLYLKGWPCQVIYDGRMAIMRSWQGPLGILPSVPSDDDKDKWPRRVPGWPGDPILGTYYQIDRAEFDIVADDYKLNFTWGYNYLGSPVNRDISDGVSLTDTLVNTPRFNWGNPDVTHICYLGFLWRMPTGIMDRDIPDEEQQLYVSSGVLLTGEGLPTPRTKYQVLSVIDDDGGVAFDYLRFSGP